MDKEIIDESVYLRVTTPLKHFMDYSQVPTAILDYAADRGTRVHRYAYLYANNLLFGEEIDLDCHPYLQAFINWFDENVEEVVSTEERLFCDDMKIQGSPDLVCYLKNKPREFGAWVTDTKTSLNFSKTWDLQTAAYKHLVLKNGINVAGRLVVHVKKDETYSEIYYDDYINCQTYLDQIQIYDGVVKAHRYLS